MSELEQLSAGDCIELGHRRHDITDIMWLKIDRKTPGSLAKVGRRAIDNRLFIHAIVWIIRTGGSMEGSSVGPWRFEEYAPTFLSLVK
jgi:hypothetical protein